MKTKTITALLKIIIAILCFFAATAPFFPQNYFFRYINWSAMMSHALEYLVRALIFFVLFRLFTYQQQKSDTLALIGDTLHKQAPSFGKGTALKARPLLFPVASSKALLIGLKVTAGFFVISFIALLLSYSYFFEGPLTFTGFQQVVLVLFYAFALYALAKLLEGERDITEELIRLDVMLFSPPAPVPPAKNPSTLTLVLPDEKIPAAAQIDNEPRLNPDEIRQVIPLSFKPFPKGFSITQPLRLAPVPQGREDAPPLLGLFQNDLLLTLMPLSPPGNSILNSLQEGRPVTVIPQSVNFTNQTFEMLVTYPKKA